MKYLIPLAALVLISLPLVNVYRGVITGKKAKKRLVFNIASFFGICLFVLAFPISGFVSAAADTTTTVNGLAYIAAALPTAFSTIAAGIAVASAASAAIGATSENPESFAKSLIFVALAEGVALYGMLISFMILNAI